MVYLLQCIELHTILLSIQWSNCFWQQDVSWFIESSHQVVLHGFFSSNRLLLLTEPLYESEKRIINMIGRISHTILRVKP